MSFNNYYFGTKERRKYEQEISIRLVDGGLSAMLHACCGGIIQLNIVDIDILDKMDDIHSALSEASKRGVYEDTYGGLYYDNGRIILLTTNA